ncbi:MAG: ferrochelatase [Anaerolineae bacterium]|nr:ferrochelatase [Anaerolineae bacterium]
MIPVLTMLSGLIGGLAFQRWLTAAPEKSARLGWLTALIGAASAILVALTLSGWNLVLGSAAWLAGFIAAYWAANEAYLNQEENRVLPALAPDESAQQNARLAVIYFTHGEPPAYDPFPWLETFRELDELRAPFIPRALRSFFFRALREEYRKIGRSPHNAIHARIFDALTQRLQGKLPGGTLVAQAFLDTNPRPDEQAVIAVNRGAKRILLVPVFLTESSHTQAGLEMVTELGLSKLGVQVAMSQPLWNDPSLRQLYGARAAQHVAPEARARTGMLLVAHGQPDSWDAVFPLQTVQERQFCDALRQGFIDEGYDPALVEMAWMEFKNPRPGEAARKLAARGAETILLIPASMSAKSIHSQVQIPELVEKAHLPASVRVINLGAWDEDAHLLDALENAITSNDIIFDGEHRAGG